MMAGPNLPDNSPVIILRKKIERPLPPGEDLTTTQLAKRERNLREDIAAELKFQGEGAKAAHEEQEKQFREDSAVLAKKGERLDAWGALKDDPRATAETVKTTLNARFRAALSESPMVPKGTLLQNGNTYYRELAEYAASKYKTLTENFQKDVQQKRVELRNIYFKNLQKINSNPLLSAAERLQEEAKEKAELQSHLIRVQTESRAKLHAELVQLRNQIEFGGIPGNINSLEEMCAGPGYAAMRPLINAVNDRLDTAETAILEKADNLIREEELFNLHWQQVIQELIEADANKDTPEIQAKLRELNDHPYRRYVKDFDRLEADILRHHVAGDKNAFIRAASELLENMQNAVPEVLGKFNQFDSLDQKLVHAFSQGDNGIDVVNGFPYASTIPNIDALLIAFKVAYDANNEVGKRDAFEAIKQAIIVQQAHDPLIAARSELYSTENAPKQSFLFNPAALKGLAADDLKPVVKAFNVHLNKAEPKINALCEADPRAADFAVQLENIYLNCAKQAFKDAGVERDKDWADIQRQAKDYAEGKLDELKGPLRDHALAQHRNQKKRQEHIAISNQESEFANNLRQLADGEKHKSKSGITYERKGGYFEASVQFPVPNIREDGLAMALFGPAISPMAWPFIAIKEAWRAGKRGLANRESKNLAQQFRDPEEMAMLGENLQGSPVIVSCSDPKMEARLTEYFREHGGVYGIEVLPYETSSDSSLGRAMYKSAKNKAEKRADKKTGTEELVQSKRSRQAHAGSSWVDARKESMGKAKPDAAHDPLDNVPDVPVDGEGLTIHRGNPGNR